MKKSLKISGYIVGGGVLLVAIALSLALTSSVQTWAVRKATSDQKGMKVDIARVAAGFSGADVSDLRFEQDGMIITAKGVSAKYSAWDFIKSRKLNADDVSVQDLVVDMRNVTRSPAPAGGPGAAVPPGTKTPAAATAKPTPFDGLLKQLQLAVDVRVGTLNVKGQALLPDNQTATFTLKGARIEAGQSGKLEWTADFADTTVGAVLRSLRTSGTLSVRITADRRIDLVEIEGAAAALGPKIPADQFRLSLKAEQPTAGGNENYALSLGRVNNATVEPLFKTSATWTAAAREIAGTWELGIRSEQLATLLAGLGLPEIAANGTGKFSVKPDAQAATASGSLRAHLAQLATLSPDLAAVGSVDLVTGFDGALVDGVARLDKLDLELTAADGRKFAQLGLIQKVSYTLKDQNVTLTDPRAEAARIALQALPLAWLQPILKPLAIESGDLSLTLAIEGEPDGSRVRVKTIDAVTLRNVTIRDAQKKALVEKTTVTLRPSVDYSAAKVSAQLAGITITTPAGDNAAGNVSIEVTNLKTKPVIVFASQLTAKVVTAHKPFLPAGLELGPLDVTFASEGRHEGDSVRLTKSIATVNRAGGVLLAGHELLQPVELDLKTQKFTFANPTAAAVRLRVGEIPLAWAESFVAKSKLGGVFAGATFELTLRALDDLSLTTAEPVLLRGIAVTMDGRPLLQGLDLSATLGGTLRGKSVGFELKRLEARQADTVLASVSAKGETTLTTKAMLTAKGELEADVAALTRQPALAQFATLARGRVTANFDATMADLTTAKLVLAVRDLVAKQNNQPLGTLDTTVDLTLKADGSGKIDAPFTLTNGSRKSDLTLAGTFRKAADNTTLVIEGKVGSSNLIVDDFQALTVLAPAAAPAQPAAPAGRSGPTPTVVRAPRPTTPAPASPPVRDTQPFWKGFNGQAELDLNRVLYGKDYTVSAIRGKAVITDSKLSLDSLDGAFNGTPFKLGGSLAFTETQAKPYTMAGTVDVTGFDVGAFMRARDPKEPPQVETKVTVKGTIGGTAATVGLLADGATGKFDITGSKGVLRALSKSSIGGKVLSGVSTVADTAVKGAKALTGILSALGKAPPPQLEATVAAVEPNIDLVRMLGELQIDDFKMSLERSGDLNYRISALEFTSSVVRITGKGIVNFAPDTPPQDLPMAIELQMGAKGALGTLLRAARVLGTESDPKGYTLVRQGFTIRGTPIKPDSSELWKIITTSAISDGGSAISNGASAGASAIEGLFRKKK